MPAKEYHANEATSRSALSLFAESPLQYKHKILDGNSNGVKQAFHEGTYLHTGLMEPDKLPKQLMTTSTLYNSQTWRDTARDNPDSVVIPEKEVDKLNSILQFAASDKHVIEILKAGKVEESFFTEDPVTKLPLKCRPDMWFEGAPWDVGLHYNFGSTNPDFNLTGYDKRFTPRITVVDWKFIGAGRGANPSHMPSGFAWTVRDYKYHWQAMWYRWVMSLEFKCDPEEIAFVFCIISKDEPLHLWFTELPPIANDIAAREIRDNLDKLGMCKKADDYPATGKGINDMATYMHWLNFFNSSDGDDIANCATEGMVLNGRL